MTVRVCCLSGIKADLWKGAGARNDHHTVLFDTVASLCVTWCSITNDATAVVLTPIFINGLIKQGSYRGKEEILPLLPHLATLVVQLPYLVIHKMHL